MTAATMATASATIASDLSGNPTLSTVVIASITSRTATPQRLPLDGSVFINTGITQWTFPIDEAAIALEPR